MRIFLFPALQNFFLAQSLRKSILSEMSEREKRDKEPKYVSDVYPVLLWIAAALFSVSLGMSLVLFYSGDKNDRLCGRHEQNSLYEEG